MAGGASHHPQEHPWPGFTPRPLSESRVAKVAPGQKPRGGHELLAPTGSFKAPVEKLQGSRLLESKGLKCHFSSLLPEWSLCCLWCAQRREVGEMTANRALSPSPEAQGQMCTWVLDTERGWEAPRGAGGQRAGGCRGGRETCQRQGATRGPQDWMGMEVKPQQRLSGWPDPGNSNPRRTRTHPNAESCLGANVTGRAPSCHQAQGHHLRDSMA